MNRIIAIIFLSILLLFLSFRRVKAQVVINEFVPDSSQEWIEFYNASASADYIKAYYVDDDTDFLSDSGSSSKKLLTNLNTTNPTFPTIDTSSFLNNSGDWVVLFDQNGVLVDQYQFISDPGKDISIGRYPDLTGIFSILAYSTKADANSAPLTPVPTPTPSLTPTPTPVPTPTPTLSSSPTPTRIPTPTPTKTPTPVPTDSPEGSVLGEEVDFPSPTAIESVLNSTEKSNKKFPFLAAGLIFLGMGFIGFSIFSIIKSAKRGYTDEGEKRDSQIS